MRKVGSGTPQVSKGSTSSSSEISSSSQAAQQPAQQLKTEKQEASSSAALTEDKRSQRKQQKQLSGVMAQAAFQHGIDQKGKSKVTDKSSAVQQTQDVQATGDASQKGAMTPVKVNVLASTANVQNLKQVGDSVQDRLAFMDRVCAKAHAGIPASQLGKGEKELNLFVAPEWVFSKHSNAKDAAYTPKQMQEITDGLKDMSKKYPGMMIVGGSVNWEIPDKSDKNKSLMYNSSVVVQDGKIVHMYHKRAEGGETVVSAQNKGTVKKEWAMGSPEIRGKLEHSNPALPSNTSLFTHKGMNFSMEICADQADRASLKEYISKHPDGKGTDVHILISAGMTLNPKRTPVKDGGLVLQVDGNYNDQTKVAGKSSAGIVQRPSISIKDWNDRDLQGTNTGEPAAKFVTPSDLADAGGTTGLEAEGVKLFSGMTVMVPKK